MNVNQRGRKNEGMLTLEESWWGSLLAEEDRYQERFEDRYPSVRLEGRSALPLAAPAVAPTEAYWCGGPEHGSLAQIEVDWLQARRLFDADQSLEVQVNGYNRGGLLVEAPGLHGFVPVSHLVDLSSELHENQREAVLGAYLSATLDVKIIECDPERGRVVFSERAALAGAGRRNQLLSQLSPGECVQGVVTNLTDFGVFVDLGGVEGLVHVSEISWGRVRHPTDLLKIGEQVTAYILQVDRERARIALSLKRLCSNPWEHVELRYHTGQVVEAVITSLASFGAFARLEDGLDGLIHLSEMGLAVQSAPGPALQPAGQPLPLCEGQQVTVRILNIDPQRQRLGLSLVLD
jgi:small subunit ribosomal protein S1